MNINEVQFRLWEQSQLEGSRKIEFRIVWKAGCLETCVSGLGLGPKCNSSAYTTQ